MTLRQYLLLMSFTTIICWVAWFFVIFNVDPAATGQVGPIFFYVSLFLSLSGSFSVFGILIKGKILKNNDVIFRHVKHIFRQGIFFSLLVIVALFLLQRQLLTWWSGVLLLVIFLISESFFFANRKYKNKDLINHV